MSLNFKAFNTELNYDWLEVRDGDSASSNLIGSRISGSVNSSQKLSTGNSMTIIFDTDHSGPRSGFEVQVEKIKVLEGNGGLNVGNRYD